MSFRDKLESKIAGAVQNFVSPPEFTLPDILFDRLLSTENAEKEEESYYENESPSNNDKDGGERQWTKQSNAPKSSKDKNTIIDLLRGDFNHLDDNYKKCKKIIILFLSMMYPTESFSRKTDVTVLEYMNELQEYFKKYKL